MVEEITAIGLLHVGMNIPREFFLPFADSAAKAFELLQNELANTAFRWPPDVGFSSYLPVVELFRSHMSHI